MPHEGHLAGSRTPASSDFRLTYHGTITTITQLSDACREWVEENVEIEPWQRFGTSIALEPRYIEQLAIAMIEDGLVMEGDPWRRTEGRTSSRDEHGFNASPPPDPGWMGDPTRGASHGRPDCVHNPLVRPWLGTERLYLRRLRLDSGGYDEGGAYWGHGEPLYWATHGAGVHVFRRAPDRTSAKRIILQQFPTARFYQ